MTRRVQRIQFTIHTKPATRSSSEQSEDPEDNPETRYPTRERKALTRYADYHCGDFEETDYDCSYLNVPNTYNEAVQQDDTDQWISAMEEEINF